MEPTHFIDDRERWVSQALDVHDHRAGFSIASLKEFAYQKVMRSLINDSPLPCDGREILLVIRQDVDAPGCRSQLVHPTQRDQRGRITVATQVVAEWSKKPGPHPPAEPRKRNLSPAELLEFMDTDVDPRSK